MPAAVIGYPLDRSIGREPSKGVSKAKLQFFGELSVCRISSLPVKGSTGPWDKPESF
jgi:hypothetical protein